MISFVKKKARCLILCFCIVLLCLFGCTPKTSPKTVINALKDSEVGIGGGRTYSFTAEEGSDGYLSDDMLLSLYGFDRGLEGLSDGAVYLAEFFYPCEFAIFVCESTATSEDVALFLRNRLELLDKNAAFSAPFCEMSVEEYRAYIQDAEVIISGKCVALIISSDVREAKRVFYRNV